MESRLISIALFVLLSVVGFAQPTSFYKVFSGNGYDEAQGLTQLVDSSFLITGSSSSFENAPNQAFLLNIDKQGNYLWSKDYGGEEFDEGKRVFSVDNFGHYVIGTSTSGSSHDFDGYLFFTNPAGDLQWEKWFDYGSWEKVRGAVMLPDTSIVAIAQTDSTNSGDNDFYMLRLDKTGEVIWSKKWGSSGDDFLNGISIITDSTFAICGTKYVSDSLINKAYVGYFKYDGTEIWDSTYCSNGWGELNDIHYYNNVLRGIGQYRFPGDQYWKYYHVDLDLNGNQTYESYFASSTGGGRYVHFTQYTASGDKLFVIRMVDDPGFPTYADGEDNICSRYTSTFNWDANDRAYSNVGQDNVNQIIPTMDGYAAFVGSHQYYCCGGGSLFIVKIGDDVNYPNNVTNPVIYDMVSVKENEQELNVSVYPNPFDNKITIVLPESELVDITIVNQLGQRIDFYSNLGGTVELPTEGYSQGFYLIRINGTNGSAVLRMVK